MTNSIREIRDADFLFVIGSNTSEAHPIIAMEMKRAALRGATLVVADPRNIWLTTIADKHLALRPGSDVWLLNAMANVIVSEGLVDEDFIANNTEGFESVKQTVASYTPEAAEEVTGIAADDIRWAARKYATTERAGIYYTLGITEHAHGTDNVYALSNLVLMTGHLGKASTGLNPLRGQNNVQGANDAGAAPVYYPGYQRGDDPEAQKKYEAAWGCELATPVRRKGLEHIAHTHRRFKLPRCHHDPRRRGVWTDERGTRPSQAEVGQWRGQGPERGGASLSTFQLRTVAALPHKLLLRT